MLLYINRYCTPVLCWWC